MTFEHKCFVSPEDILAVRIGCASCKAMRTIPVDKLSAAALEAILTQSCPHCNAPSKFPNGTSEMNHLIQFNILLNGLGGLLSGRNIKYGFEIECPDDRAKDTE